MSTSGTRRLTAANAATIDAGDRITVAAPDEVGDDVRFDRILANHRSESASRHFTTFDPLADTDDPRRRCTSRRARTSRSDSLARWLEVGHPVDRI